MEDGGWKRESRLLVSQAENYLDCGGRARRRHRFRTGKYVDFPAVAHLQKLRGAALPAAVQDAGARLAGFRILRSVLECANPLALWTRVAVPNYFTFSATNISTGLQ